MNRTLADTSARRFATVRAELASLPETEESVRHDRSLGDIPLVVLAAGKAIATFEPRAYPKGTDLDSVRQTWRLLLGEIAGHSTRGRVKEINGAGHHIPLERPDAVIEAVREVLEDIRVASRSGSVR
jgi:pimeloyl-ACP methyl ester carboxylesterase